MGPHFLFLFQQLEQEKHRLRLQIEVMEDEYEQRIADLRSDLAAMKTRDSIQQNPCIHLCIVSHFEIQNLLDILLNRSPTDPPFFSLSEAESRAREKDRERAHLVGQLGEQNQRLTGELEAASRREEELTRQVEELRVQFQDKRETMRDHVMHLETLKDEVSKHARSLCSADASFSLVKST